MYWLRSRCSHVGDDVDDGARVGQCFIPVPAPLRGELVSGNGGTDIVIYLMINQGSWWHPMVPGGIGVLHRLDSDTGGNRPSHMKVAGDL